MALLEQVFEVVEVFGLLPLGDVQVRLRALPGWEIGNVQDSRVIREQVEVILGKDFLDRGRRLWWGEEVELIQGFERFGFLLVREDPVESGAELAFGDLPGGGAGDPLMFTIELIDLEEGAFQPVAGGDLLRFLRGIKQTALVGVEEVLQCTLQRGG